MNVVEMKNLGYPSNIEEMIQNTEGVDLMEDHPSYYLINDTYNDSDRVLQINKNADFIKTYFEFFNNDVNKEELYEFAKKLPPILFMNLKKIYFVEKEEDLQGELDENCPNHTFYFDDPRNPVGMAVHDDSVAIINLRTLKELASEEAIENKRVFGHTSGSDNILFNALCETIAHELFHLAQFNPLIEELIPEGEEPAEEFCRFYSNHQL